VPGWYSANVVGGLLDIWQEGNHGWFLIEPSSPHSGNGGSVCGVFF
jgi:hypothetical protein